MTAAEADIHSTGLRCRVWLLWLQMVAARAWRLVAMPAALRHVGSRWCDRCRGRGRCLAWHRRGRAAILRPGPPRVAVLAVHAASVVQWVVCAPTGSVQDAWRLHPCVCGELNTHICGSASAAAAETLAVDREAANASHCRRAQNLLRC